MKTLRMILVPASVLAMSTAAIAAPVADRPQPATRAELQKMLADHFAVMDANKDGVLTGDEHKAAMERRRAEHFSAADKDRDGKLSQAEFDAMREDRRAARPKPADARMAKMEERREARREAMMNRTETRDQFMSRRLAMFDRVDTDRDGTISAAERDAARAKMRGRLRDRGAMPPPPAPAG